METIRDTIFISHATPEDNEFAVWLAARLEILGYKVWIDKNELLGGEKFWEKIDLVIRNEAMKVLLIYSERILQNGQPGKLRDGIYKEYSLAESISKQHPELSDFITLIRIDHSPYNLFIGADRLNQIPFTDNWGAGLDILLEKFKKDCLVKNPMSGTDFSEWYLNNLSIKNPIIEKKELYYTNWWSVKTFPDEFFIIQFSNEVQAKAVYDINANYPIAIIANCITSFTSNLIFTINKDRESIDLKPARIHTIKMPDLLLGFEKESFPSNKDATNHFKKLLKRAFHLHVKKMGLNWHELSNKSLAYYHTYKSLPNTKVSFFYPYSNAVKPKRKNLFGKYLTLGKWHYAISLKPTLEPFLGFAIKSHIIFTTDGFRTWQQKELMHTHRRKKGKRMFNEEWRDLLIGYINSLKNNSQPMEIAVTQNLSIVMQNNLETYWSEMGYIDPSDAKRQELLIGEEKDEEIEEDLNEEEAI